MKTTMRGSPVTAGARSASTSAGWIAVRRGGEAAREATERARCSRRRLGAATAVEERLDVGRKRTTWNLSVGRRRWSM